MKVNHSAPEKALVGIKKIFEDHEELSDFMWKKNEITEDLQYLRQVARGGRISCNDSSTLWLRRFVSAIRAEVDELDNSIPWKWWRKEKTDLQNVRVEIIDIFHFLLSAAACAGMDGEDFIKLYYQKRKLNFDRQVHGFKKNDNKKLGINKK